MLGFRWFGKVHGSDSVNCERKKRKMFFGQHFDLKVFKLTAKFTAPIIAIASSFALTSPSSAISNPFRRNTNDYRVCAARLLSIGIPAETTGSACAAALKPLEVSSCVGQIQQRVQIPATDSLSFCGEARRPNDLATCVVDIGTKSQEAANPAILSYCSRSLLPVDFSQCVVGLTSEIDLSSTQAMESCISPGDRISNVVPFSTPRVTPSVEFSPTFETTPIR